MISFLFYEEDGPTISIHDAHDKERRDSTGSSAEDSLLSIPPLTTKSSRESLNVNFGITFEFNHVKFIISGSQHKKSQDDPVRGGVFSGIHNLMVKASPSTVRVSIFEFVSIQIHNILDFGHDFFHRRLRERQRQGLREPNLATQCSIVNIAQITAIENMF